jgi:hypothetical protein
LEKKVTKKEYLMMKITYSVDGKLQSNCHYKFGNILILETELAEAKKKLRQYEKTKRVQEQDRRKIVDLQREI